MIYIGDYVALGLVLILSVFFYDSRPFVTRSSKYYAACLILTASTAALDLISCGGIIAAESFPVHLNWLINSGYFIINIVTTSVISLFYCLKILENVYNSKCVTQTKAVFGAIFTVYTVAVVLNRFYGWFFYIDETGNYVRGSFNQFGYYVGILQMCLVILCYFRYRKQVTVTVKRAMLQSTLVIILYVIYQFSFPQIMMNSTIFAMIDMILFLNFQGQRMGKHNLTKLNDRVRFFKDIDVQIRNNRMQVFMVYIRKFGEVNRKFGNKIADEVLYQFAFSLEDLFDGGKAYHMNGTAFALVLPYKGEEVADSNRNALSDFLKKGVLYIHNKIHLDSIMVEYITDSSDTDTSDFYEKLEYTMSLAKSEKKEYILYSKKIGDYMKRIQYLTERLKTVDREHGFRMYFQPIYCVKTGKFCSMEALIRLFEPDGSVISPGEFIPVAEKNGSINEITWFVLEESCRLLSSTHLYDDIAVSVNLPMLQLLEQDFENKLDSLLEKYGISKRRICLEFTERAILDDFDRAKDYMVRMANRGYRFFLDDFGTGYSNFNCLLQLPFDNIKLDRSLCINMKKDATGERLMKVLITLFHDMNLVVISEGAEEQDEVEMLMQFGIDKIQGFYYAKPMDEEHLKQFYLENPVGED